MKEIIHTCMKDKPETCFACQWFDEILAKAKAARSCPYHHYCERASHITREFRLGHPAPECEVWDDGAEAEPEMVFSGSKVDCQAFLAEKACIRFRLEVNGICKVCDLYDQRKQKVKQGSKFWK